jgi:two-component system, LytTR family, response regulator
MPEPISTLIVDDEPLARERLRSLLADRPAFTIVGECANGGEAVDALRSVRPELVFLDVQMPELDGFEVLRAIDPDDWPAVVFVTAYDQYALKAFDVHALDYLLKPFDRARFERALGRAEAELRDRRAQRGADSRLIALVESLRRDRQRPHRIVVRSDARIAFVNVAEIDWIEAAGNYVTLHVGPAAHLLRDTMKRLERELAGARFARLHRSAMVNLDRVRELRQTADGTWEVLLADGTRLNAGREADARLRAILGREGREGQEG